jgi:Wax ester synthase/diacylglycerol acyltransferase catalytic domain
VAERLSALDAAFLRLESERAPMHIGWRALFEPPPARARPGLAAIRALVGARVAHVPRCRQRLAFPALGIGEPAWVDDPEFDAADHVIALAVDDEALSLEAFNARGDRFLSAPLDRRRALWQIGLVPRLDDGRVGVVGKVHYAMADGIAATRDRRTAVRRLIGERARRCPGLEPGVRARRGAPRAADADRRRHRAAADHARGRARRVARWPAWCPR